MSVSRVRHNDVIAKSAMTSLCRAFRERQTRDTKMVTNLDPEGYVKGYAVGDGGHQRQQGPNNADGRQTGRHGCRLAARCSCGHTLDRTPLSDSRSGRHEQVAVDAEINVEMPLASDSFRRRRRGRSRNAATSTCPSASMPSADRAALSSRIRSAPSRFHRPHCARKQKTRDLGTRRTVLGPSLAPFLK